MSSLFDANTPPLDGATTVQYDVVTSFVLTYINWIILAISLFVIIYCTSVYYKKKAAKRGTD